MLKFWLVVVVVSPPLLTSAFPRLNALQVEQPKSEIVLLDGRLVDHAGGSDGAGVLIATKGRALRALEL